MMNDKKPKEMRLQMKVWTALSHSHAHITDTMETAFREAELPPLKWYEVLAALVQAENQALLPSVLADLIHISRSNTTRLLDRMEGAGLIERRDCPHDRRCRYVALTDTGHNRWELMNRVYEPSLMAVMKLSRHEIETLNDLLQKISPDSKVSSNSPHSDPCHSDRAHAARSD